MSSIIFMINTLIDENNSLKISSIPQDKTKQEELLRALMNVREPGSISDKFLEVQNEYLQDRISKKGISNVEDMENLREIASSNIKNADKLYLWKGDITTIKADAIVNAANKTLLGCRLPLHYCIDNAIHTFAGIQLRNECNEIIQKQGFEEPTGKAKITKAYNLPCKYIIHTVGPIVINKVSEEDEKMLESSYYESLKIAEENQLNSIVFCSISTGEFRFPKDIAAKIAIKTVDKFLEDSLYLKKVVFNVFSDEDYNNYQNLIRVGIYEKK